MEIRRTPLYYKEDLALVHHLGFGFHADLCAPGILTLLDPIRERDGLVVELGCGSGLLTRHLVDAGLRVIATDASPAMLALAREHVPDAEDCTPGRAARRPDTERRRDRFRRPRIVVPSGQPEHRTVPYRRRESTPTGRRPRHRPVRPRMGRNQAKRSSQRSHR